MSSLSAENVFLYQQPHCFQLERHRDHFQSHLIRENVSASEFVFSLELSDADVMELRQPRWQ